MFTNNFNLSSADTCSRMLRGYLERIGESIQSVFVSETERNKKHDGAQRAYSIDSVLEKILQHEQAWIILVVLIIALILILFLLFAALISAVFGGSGSLDTPSNLINVEYDHQLLEEVDEVVIKLLDYRKRGNMKEYEDFLNPMMRKYCLDHLDPYHLSRVYHQHAQESLHLNLAKIITLAASGVKFSCFIIVQSSFVIMIWF